MPMMNYIFFYFIICVLLAVRNKYLSGVKNVFNVAFYLPVPGVKVIQQRVKVATTLAKICPGFFCQGLVNS